jgi:hypothetical protein
MKTREHWVIKSRSAGFAAQEPRVMVPSGTTLTIEPNAPGTGNLREQYNINN